MFVVTGNCCFLKLNGMAVIEKKTRLSLDIRIRRSFIAKCVCTHKEFVLVLGASSTESTNLVKTTYNYINKKHL